MTSINTSTRLTPLQIVTCIQTASYVLARSMFDSGRDPQSTLLEAFDTASDIIMSVGLQTVGLPLDDVTQESIAQLPDELRETLKFFHIMSDTVSEMSKSEQREEQLPAE